MPEWIFAIITIGFVVGAGYILWKASQREQQQKELKAQREHDLKLLKASKRILGKKIKLDAELEKQTIKTTRKSKKDQLVHELHMNDKNTTADKAIEIIPESLKNASEIIKNLKK